MTERTWSVVRNIFSADLCAEAGRLVETECGNNLPLLGDFDDVRLERVRFGVLKLSGGTLDGLREAIRIAKIDWRDTLVGAGFGSSLTAHKEWATQVLSRDDD